MIGKRIKEARKAAGVVQAALADAIGVTQSTVSLWEMGETSPTAENSAAAAVFLHVSFEWLATGRGEMTYGVQSPRAEYALPDEHKELLRLFSRLSPKRRAALIELLKKW